MFETCIHIFNIEINKTVYLGTRGPAAWRSGIWTVSGSILPSGNLGLEIISTLTRIQVGQFQLLAKGCALNKYWLSA